MPLCCSCSMRPSIVMKKQNISGQYSSSLVLNKEPNYSTHSTFGRRLYCFRNVYGLTTRSELTSAMCRDRQAHQRYCATHMRKASSDYHCGSTFATDRTLKKKSPRTYYRVPFITLVQDFRCTFQHKMLIHKQCIIQITQVQKKKKNLSQKEKYVNLIVFFFLLNSNIISGFFSHNARYLHF